MHFTADLLFFVLGSYGVYFTSSKIIYIDYQCIISLCRKCVVNNQSINITCKIFYYRDIIH